METKTNDEIISIKPEGNIRKCPACGHNDGFHVSSEMEDDSKEENIISFPRILPAANDVAPVLKGRIYAFEWISESPPPVHHPL